MLVQKRDTWASRFGTNYFLVPHNLHVSCWFPGVHIDNESISMMVTTKLKIQKIKWLLDGGEVKDRQLHGDAKKQDDFTTARLLDLRNIWK
jgi:hypothetical protein